nr:hypothetical protein [Tanacetum cinerariifolium]
MEEYIRLEEEKARRCAIVYNDALTSEVTLSCKPTPLFIMMLLDFFAEPTISPQHIDEFSLKDEPSFFECDEEEQNVLYFNDLFPFNVIYLDDKKSDTDNVNNEINIEGSLGDMSVVPLPNTFHMAYRTPMDTAPQYDVSLGLEYGILTPCTELEAVFWAFRLSQEGYLRGSMACLVKGIMAKSGGLLTGIHGLFSERGNHREFDMNRERLRSSA